MTDGTVSEYDAANFFSDQRLIADPYPYYEYLRGQCPVAHVPSSGVVAVTGYDELTDLPRRHDVLRDQLVAGALSAPVRGEC
jgi:cytochrome P450